MPNEKQTAKITMRDKVEKVSIYIKPEIAKALRQYALDNNITQSEAHSRAIIGLTGKK